MSLDLKKVFDLKHNVFIEACAGAGKTWLLSKRYVAIMDDFARQELDRPDLPGKNASNILVITFTKKAQAEMAGRIYEDLNQVLSGAKLEHVPSGFGQHLMNAPDALKMHFRSTYSQNAISTIDSFCTQILRDQAELIGMDPEFRIQDDVDTKMIEMETLERYLRTESEAHNEDMRIILDHLSTNYLKSYLRKLSEHYQLISRWIDHHANSSPEVLIEEFKTSNPIPGWMEGITQLLSELAEDIPVPHELLNPNHVQYRTLAKLKSLFSGTDHMRSYEVQLELLEILKQLTLTAARTNYYKNPQLDKAVWSETWIQVLQPKLRALLDAVNGTVPIDQLISESPNTWDILACHVNHHLAKFFLGYQSALERRYRQEGVLSFNEVIVRTHELLSNHPKLQAYYGNRYDHILFDEFQDTNDLRWHIVKLIAKAGNENLRDRGLFIVGDTKQSIYRFNQADVQVMNSVRSLIDSEGGNVQTADVTYRSSKKYVEEIINPLMHQIFPESMDGQPLFATYFQSTSLPEIKLRDPHKDHTALARISLILNDNHQNNSRADIIKTAESTKTWDAWLDQKEIKHKNGPRIGILLRSFTKIVDYIRVFTELDLDFEVVTGKGLFKEQECYDIYNLISFLNNPLDDYALVGILRSPFFIMQDGEIQTLRDNYGENLSQGWLWAILQNTHPDIAGTLQSWLDRTAHEPIDRLLTSIVSEGERQLGWISETGGALRLQNIHLLIHKLHQRSLDGMTLREMQEYLKFQIQHGDASQSELPGSSKIQIMTIHKAKGLEFPVVILPELHRRSPSDKTGMVIGRTDEGWGVGIQIDTVNGNKKTSTYRRLYAQAKAEESAEDKRLFYVAVTRAQYGVEFLTRLNPEKKIEDSTWWMKYVQPNYAKDLSKESLEGDLNSFRSDWEDRSTEFIKYEFSFASELLGRKRRELESVSEQYGNDPQLERLGYQEISPHTIMAWMEAGEFKADEEPRLGLDRGDEVVSRKFGTLLHRVMEMEWYDVHFHRRNILMYLDELEVDKADQDPFMNELAECMAIYRNSDLAKLLETIPESNKLRELPLHAYLKGVGTVFKVSGIIDLLYQNADEWVVLDYKSDRELISDSDIISHPYWYQIQTYLWMIHLMYGIRARGQLYYSRHDKTIEISYDPDRYFSALASMQLKLSPVILNNSSVTPELRTTLNDLPENKPVMLLEPTKLSCENRMQSLAEAGLLHPRLQVVTLKDFRKRLEPIGRRLTPYLTRLGIASLTGKQVQWGSVNRLASAFYRVLGGETLVPDKMPLFDKFKRWCEDHELLLPGSAWTSDLLQGDPHIIVNAIHSTTPSDYVFLSELSKHSSLTFFDPLNAGQASSGFNMKIEDWSGQERMPQNAKWHSYVTCYSMDEEVMLHGLRIQELVRKGARLDDIMIAVPSMELYVPVIKREFAEMGIPVRLSKREPVMERPIVQLAFSIIRGKLQRRLTWEMLAAVWLHPLVIPSGRSGLERQEIDLEVRRVGLIFLDDVLEYLHKQSKWRSVATKVAHFVDKTWGSEVRKTMSSQVAWLTDTFKTFKPVRALEQGTVAFKAYNSLNRALANIENDWSLFMGRRAELRDLQRELRERLSSVEVSSSTQEYGVDIISLLDTLTLENEYLFVMGLNEGHFPLTPETNPYLKLSQFNPWFMNLALFSRWLARDNGRLFLTSPGRDSEGKHLQESTFCEYLKQVKVTETMRGPLSRRFRSASGRVYTDPTSDYEVRHNDLLQDRGRGKWYGDLSKDTAHSEISISATAFDDLIKCPQRFWYGRMLNLQRAETDLEARDETWVGNLVHKVLEDFGKAGGFDLARTDLDEALKLLSAVSSKCMEREGVDPGSNLLNLKRTNHYFTNYNNPEKNLLSKMIKNDADLLEAFNVSESYEQVFGGRNEDDSWPAYEIDGSEVKLKLHGKIDRVFEGDEHVWGVDYKTGYAELKDSREFWSSQMLFYYLVLKSNYPDKNVVLSYEQLKSMRKDEHGVKAILGDTLSDNPVLSINKRQHKLQIDEGAPWSIPQIKATTLNYAQHIVDNSFPLTERDEERACKYCDFERICRKTSLPR